MEDGFIDINRGKEKHIGQKPLIKRSIQMAFLETCFLVEHNHMPHLIKMLLTFILYEKNVVGGHGWCLLIAYSFIYTLHIHTHLCKSILNREPTKMLMFQCSQSSLSCVLWFFSVEIPWRRRNDKRADPIFTCGRESFHIQ